jgi:hypothetical protein
MNGLQERSSTVSCACLLLHYIKRSGQVSKAASQPASQPAVLPALRSTGPAATTTHVGRLGSRQTTSTSTRQYRSAVVATAATTALHPWVSVGREVLAIMPTGVAKRNQTPHHRSVITNSAVRVRTLHHQKGAGGMHSQTRAGQEQTKTHNDYII